VSELREVASREAAISSTRPPDGLSRSGMKPSVVVTLSAARRAGSRACRLADHLSVRPAPGRYRRASSAADTVQAIVEEMARSPLGRPAPGVAIAAASPAMTDGSPTLPPEDDMRLRPDRALDRLVAPRRPGRSTSPLVLPAPVSEQATRHVLRLRAFAEYDRHSLTGVGDLRARAEMHQTAEQLAPQTASIREPVRRRCARGGGSRGDSLEQETHWPLRCREGGLDLSSASRTATGSARRRGRSEIARFGSETVARRGRRGTFPSPIGRRSCDHATTPPRPVPVRGVRASHGEELAAEIQAHAPTCQSQRVPEPRGARAPWCRGALPSRTRAGYLSLATAAHGHLVCRKCQTRSRSRTVSSRPQATGNRDFGFAIDPRHFAVIGLCARCQAEAESSGLHR